MNYRVPDAVKQYATEDIEEVIKKINTRTPSVKAELYLLTFETGSDTDRDDQFSVYPTAIVKWTDGGRSVETEFGWDYVIDGEDVYMGGDIDDLVESLEHLMKNLKDSKIVSSTAVNAGSRIVAADGDEFNEDTVVDDIIDDEEDGISDAMDSLSDQVDDIQDAVDNMDEDEIDIELENNIENHYIAECEACHGVFISAMIESDQEVEKISGVCPLCEKESDQHLRWVVKAVER